MGCLLRDNGLSDSTVIFVECLLGAGATFTSLDSCDNNGLMIWTEQTCSQTQAPIFRAVLNLIVCSQPDLLHAIIDLDSELTLKTSDGQTILHLAKVALHESCVPFEIAIAVDWDDTAKETDGAAALVHWAATYCDNHYDYPDDMAECVSDAMIKLSAFTSTTTNFEISYAACTDIMMRVTLAGILLEAAADVTLRDCYGYNALLYASREDCAPLIQRLIAFGSPLVYGPMLWSSFRPRFMILGGPFPASAQAHTVEPLRMLYKVTARENDVETRLKVPSPLWVACAADASLQTIQLLLAEDPEINYSDAVESMIVLHVAAALGNVKSTDALLNAGYDRHSRDCNGSTAESHASIGGHQEALQLLRDASVAEVSDDQTAHVEQKRLSRFSIKDTTSDHIRSIAGTGTLQQLQSFISGGGNPRLQFRSCECTPMTTAIISGNAAKVEFLQGLRFRPVGAACRTHFQWGFYGLPSDAPLGLLSAQHTLLEPSRRVSRDAAYAITPHTFIHDSIGCCQWEFRRSSASVRRRPTDVGCAA
jgi:ankyrin repeat protein